MLAIIADIHGNLPALEAVLADIDRRGGMRIVSLGDVGGYYSQVNECIALLRSRQVLNIMGNHDFYLVSGENCPRSTSANLCLDYQRRILLPESLVYLQSSSSQLKEDDMHFVHGGWHDPREEYLTQLSHAYFANFSGRFFFSGHTHVQCLADFDAKVYCNPGSVGQPRDGDPRAAYAILNNDRIELHRVAYEVDRTAEEMTRAGFDTYYYRNLFTGEKIGGGVAHIDIAGA